MKLFEHVEFTQAVLQAAKHFSATGLRESMIEKDYYVTEALRIIAATGGNKVLFKGGTSLSKGWNLIQRFSEDIDIFLDPAAFEKPLGKNGINRELKTLSQRVQEHPGLTYVKEESKTIGGFGRNDHFSYAQKFAGKGEIRNRVLLEAGAASGTEPTVVVKLQSYVGQFLKETGVSLGAEDEGPFEMRLLHFRRTFVEKMFAINGKVEAFKSTRTPIGSYARHYYDLLCLVDQPEVQAMLKSEEYGRIKTDYDRISREHFSGSYRPPPEMTFSKSDALFPQGDLRKALATEFESQCRVLCFGKIPTWQEFQDRFDAIRSLL